MTRARAHGFPMWLVLLDLDHFALVNDLYGSDTGDEVIRAVEAVTAADAVFGSNTSSFPISALAAVAARPERVVGAHYFWPAHRQPLLEISAAPGACRGGWPISPFRPR